MNELAGYANRCTFHLEWEAPPGCTSAVVWRHRLTNGGAITVQHRMTGFGYRDQETGYSSPCGQFWLASGHFDIRDHLPRIETEEQMIDLVIANANNCTGGHHGRRYGWTLEQLNDRDNWRPSS